jgi:hypothetical protein
MRRAMLTGRSATPITVGLAAGTNAGFSDNIHISAANPAAASGTITSVSARFVVNSASNVAFFTCDSARVVRAISASVAAVNGQSSYVVSLTVQAGDFIGLWIANGNNVERCDNTAGPPGMYSNSSVNTAKPTVGQDLSGSTTLATTRQLNCAGTGTT